jgi:NAD+ synthase
MMLEPLRIHESATADTIACFIRDQISTSGLDGAVIALSGGLDSTVAAYLAVKALGPDLVRVYNMPHATSNPLSQEHACLAAAELDIAFEVIDITSQIDVYFERFPQADRLRRANKMARERMSVIYDMARVHNAMVVGTSNRTETMLGYTTLWGDMGCGIEPIGDLYKTQVRWLAGYLQIPREIIEKPPSGDLWQGQTDEEELGLTYDDTDWVLYHMLELERTEDDIAADGVVDEETVAKVFRLVKRNAFKRRLPPYPGIAACWRQPPPAVP